MWRAAIPDSYYPQLIADMCPLFAVHDAGLYLQIVKDLGRRLTKAINQYSTPSGRGVGKDLHFEAIRKKGVVRFFCLDKVGVSCDIAQHEEGSSAYTMEYGRLKKALKHFRLLLDLSCRRRILMGYSRNIQTWRP